MRCTAQRLPWGYTEALGKLGKLRLQVGERVNEVATVTDAPPASWVPSDDPHKLSTAHALPMPRAACEHFMSRVPSQRGCELRQDTPPVGLISAWVLDSLFGDADANIMSRERGGGKWMEMPAMNRLNLDETWGLAPENGDWRTRRRAS